MNTMRTLAAGVDPRFFEGLTKLTVILAVAWLMHLCLARGNPRWRAWLWRATVVGVTVVATAAFIGSAFVPSFYRIPLLATAPDDSRAVETTHVAHLADEEIRAVASNPHSPADVPAIETSAGPTFPTPVSIQSNRTDSPQAPPVRNITKVNAPFDWGFFLVALYGVVAGVLMARSIVHHLAASRLLRGAVAPPEWAQTLADEIQSATPGRSTVVLLTARLQSPVLVGVWNPVILLPESMLESRTARIDVRGALAHELAHATNRDPAWDRAIGLLSGLLWFHPLVWRWCSAHRAACEHVCDRLAADQMGSAREYQGLLARIAIRVSGHAPTVGLAMARHSFIRQRIAAVSVGRPAAKLRWKAVMAGVCAAAMFVVVGVGSLSAEPERTSGSLRAEMNDTPAATVNAPQPNARQDAGTGQRPPALTITVIHRDDQQPVANARVNVRMYFRRLAPNPPVQRQLTTDESGVAVFEYPRGQEAAVLTVGVSADGLVVNNFRFGDNLRPDDLPTEVAIPMDAGHAIGGTIVDPDGNLVTGAELSIQRRSVDSPETSYYWLLYEYDDDGAWRLDAAPPDLSPLRLSVKHPEFVDALFRLQDGVDSKYVLDPGFRLTGTITDEQGNPIPGAHITMGDRKLQPMEAPLPTDDNGAFVIPALERGATFLTAEAPGFAPQARPVEIDEEAMPQSFKLSRGHTVGFKIVNEQNEPIEGAAVRAEEWNKLRTLWWKDTSDANGLVTWNGAPAEVVEFHVNAPGYVADGSVVVSPRDEPHVVRLLRPMEISGNVTDEDDNPIREFQVVAGNMRPRDPQIAWQTNNAIPGLDGQFKLTRTYSEGDTKIRVEAPGYRPWVSEPIAHQSGSIVINARLEKAAGLKGVVLTPDGEPATGQG